MLLTGNSRELGLAPYTEKEASYSVAMLYCRKQPRISFGKSGGYCGLYMHAKACTFSMPRKMYSWHRCSLGV